jgi:hypothetical protein
MLAHLFFMSFVPVFRVQSVSVSSIISCSVDLFKNFPLSFYHNLNTIPIAVTPYLIHYIRVSNTNRSKRPVYLFLHDLLVFFTVSEHVLCLFSVLVISSAPCLSSSIFA